VGVDPAYPEPVEGLVLNVVEGLRLRLLCGRIGDRERPMEQMVKISIECNPSVFKHGVSIEDIRFAFDNRLFEYPVAGQEDKTCSSDLIDGLPPPLKYYIMRLMKIP
jgi:hypothetical protein